MCCTISRVKEATLWGCVLFCFLVASSAASTYKVVVDDDAVSLRIWTRVHNCSHARWRKSIVAHAHWVAFINLRRKRMCTRPSPPWWMPRYERNLTCFYTPHIDRASLRRHAERAMVQYLNSFTHMSCTPVCRADWNNVERLRADGGGMRKLGGIWLIDCTHTDTGFSKCRCVCGCMSWLSWVMCGNETCARCRYVWAQTKLNAIFEIVTNTMQCTLAVNDNKCLCWANFKRCLL